MSNIASAFDHGKAFIAFLTCGDPDLETTGRAVRAAIENGADLIELGIPFSDPAADGETIQKAAERAIARGFSFADCLSALRKFREQNQATPVVLMGYLNSFERRGAAQAFLEAKQSGADGVILVDCPIEALPDYQSDLQAAELAPILLCAPTTSPERQAKIAKNAQGFIYFVSLRGITGREAAAASAELKAQIESLRAHTDTPICLGFGIRSPETARQMADCADGVVIGSALVAELYAAHEAGLDICRVASEFAQKIRKALDS